MEQNNKYDDTVKVYLQAVLHTSVGGGGRGAAAPQVGQMSVSLQQFSDRTIGNLGNFSAFFPALYDISGRKFTAPLNLTSSYGHGIATRVYNNSLKS